MDLPNRFEHFSFQDDARADAANPLQGELRGTATIAIPGVYTFRDGSGKLWRELVTAEVLSDPEYLRSLEMLPVTLTHPAGAPGWGENQVVTPDTARKVTVGSIGTATARADGAIQAPIRIWDRDAATAGRTTHRDISAGYFASYDQTPGVHAGQAYDMKQTKRFGANHVAMERNGMHGPGAGIRADAAVSPGVAWRVDGNASASDSGTVALPDLTVPDPGAASMEPTPNEIAANARADAAATTMQAEKARADGAVAELATAATAHEAALVQARADALPIVRARLALEAKVQGICGKDWTGEGKTDSQCRADACAVLKVTIPADRLTDDAYLAARFDAACDAAPVRTAATVAADALNPARADATADTRTAYQKALAELARAQRG